MANRMTDASKRFALLNECKALEKAWQNKMEEISANDDLDDEEYNTLMDKAYAEYREAVGKKEVEAFALQFPKRRGWFAETFVESFGICESRKLSIKQTEVFQRYCVDDEHTWQTGKTYCRAGNKLVTLSIPRYSRGIGYLTITEF